MTVWWFLIGFMFGVAFTLGVLRLQGHSARCLDQ